MKLTKLNINDVLSNVHGCLINYILKVIKGILRSHDICVNVIIIDSYIVCVLKNITSALWNT